MELKDTIALMQSEDYKERFKAEYYQLKIRREKLMDFLDRWNRGALGFEPDSPFELLDKQLRAMTAYKDMLELRAQRENIEL